MIWSRCQRKWSGYTLWRFVWKEGSNINFVKQIDEHFLCVLMKEVEDETLACGTGATAVAITMNATKPTTATSIDVNVEGGKLAVSFDKKR
jgi:diaminopimelate epimerase